MSKKFDIHEWQAKQKRLNEELGPQSSKLDILTDRLLNVMDGRLATWQLNDTIKSSHDMMALMKRDKEKIRMMIYNLIRDDINEMSTTGTGASVTTGAGEAYATPKAFKKKNKED